MKKLVFGVAVLMFMAACSGSDSSNKENQEVDSVETTDTVSQSEDSGAVQVQESQDSLPRAEAKAEKENEVKNAAAAKYDPMLDKYESLIKKCWSMSKKGLSINDQELADIWMEAGAAGSKLDKASKNLTSEQKSRLKKLNKDYRKFCLTQPA